MSMYDKNHYNIVISLQLIKITEKKKEVPSRPQGPHLYNGNNTYLTRLLRGLSDMDLGKLLDPWK